MSYSKHYDREDKLYGYDPNEDYMKKMNQAVEQGDMEAAARYEQQRNEKIRGEGLTQYEQTNNYAKYLPKTTSQQMDEIMKQIQDREPFTFDLDGDALYQQYKDQYTKQGQLMMDDAMARAATLTGGYGNSYAQTVGQMAYQQELDKLKKLGPEIYAMRRAEYEEEGDKLYRMYGLLADRDSRDYSREQYQTEKEEALAREERDRAYELTMTMLKNGMMPSADVLAASGLSEEDAKKFYEYSTMGAGGSSYGGGSGSSSGGGSGSGYSSGGDTSKGNGKALTNTMYTNLDKAYQSGIKTGNLDEFYKQRSMLENQGYDVSAFDDWASGEYDWYFPDKSAFGSGVQDFRNVYMTVRDLINTGDMARVEAVLDQFDGQWDMWQWAEIQKLLQQKGLWV